MKFTARVTPRLPNRPTSSDGKPPSSLATLPGEMLREVYSYLPRQSGVLQSTNALHSASPYTDTQRWLSTIASFPEQLEEWVWRVSWIGRFVACMQIHRHGREMLSLTQRIDVTIIEDWERQTVYQRCHAGMRSHNRSMAYARSQLLWLLAFTRPVFLKIDVQLREPSWTRMLLESIDTFRLQSAVFLSPLGSQVYLESDMRDLVDTDIIDVAAKTLIEVRCLRASTDPECWPTDVDINFPLLEVLHFPRVCLRTEDSYMLQLALAAGRLYDLSLHVCGWWCPAFKSAPPEAFNASAYRILQVRGQELRRLELDSLEARPDLLKLDLSVLTPNLTSLTLACFTPGWLRYLPQTIENLTIHHVGDFDAFISAMNGPDWPRYMQVLTVGGLKMHEWPLLRSACRQAAINLSIEEMICGEEDEDEDEET